VLLVVYLAVPKKRINLKSCLIGIYVLDVGVTIIYPPDGTTILSTDPLPVAVATYLSGYTMNEVDFYVDGRQFAQLYSSPWNAVWTNVVPGLHRLTATGYDSDGGSYISAPVFISVANTLVQSNSVWKYLDNGSNQGTNWIAPNFDDSAWASGPAPLGYSFRRTLSADDKFLRNKREQ